VAGIEPITEALAGVDRLCFDAVHWQEKRQ
jgi:hypothetical protein